MKLIHKSICAAALTCWMLGAHAQQSNVPLLSLHVAPQALPHATEAHVDLMVSNADSQPLVYMPPAQLEGTLYAEQRTWVVTLRPVQPVSTLTIAPGQFTRIAYLLMPPADAAGRLQLEIAEITTMRALIDVQQGSPENESPVGSLAAALKQQEAAAPPAASRIGRTFANRFAFHEPIYFVYGPDAPAAKFQFSFKYRLIGKDGKFGDLIPPFRGLYFAYTQRSLWDIQADSSPFYDTSYMPELFFEWLAPGDKKSDGWFHWLGAQIGVRHESNGKADAESRSLNNPYLRTGLALGNLSGWHMIVAPKVFSYLGTSEENNDIKRYRGYGELQLSLARHDNFQLSVATRVGSSGNKGSVQIDLTQPVRIPLINLETYLQLQYFDGYGESLRTYNQKSSTWRLGLGFVR